MAIAITGPMPDVISRFVGPPRSPEKLEMTYLALLILEAVAGIVAISISESGERSATSQALFE